VSCSSGYAAAVSSVAGRVAGSTMPPRVGSCSAWRGTDAEEVTPVTVSGLAAAIKRIFKMGK